MPRFTFDDIATPGSPVWLGKTSHPHIRWHGVQALDAAPPDAPAAVVAVVTSGTGAGYKGQGYNAARFTTRDPVDVIEVVLATEFLFSGVKAIGSRDGVIVAKQAIGIADPLTPTLFRFDEGFQGVDKVVFRWRPYSDHSDDIAPDLAMDDLVLHRAAAVAAADALFA